MMWSCHFTCSRVNQLNILSLSLVGGPGEELFGRKMEEGRVREINLGNYMQTICKTANCKPQREMVHRLKAQRGYAIVVTFGTISSSK